MNPYLFVTGCPRSGTTLLQRMLDNHPWLAVSDDTRVVPRRVMPLLGPESPLTDQLVNEVVGFKRFGGLGIDEPTAWHLAGGAGTFAGFVRALFDEFARRSGKPLAGEKTPGYVRHLPVLNRLFPDARFVDIVRDGRDVALSALDWVTQKPDRFLGRLALWDEEPVAMCALWWRRQVAAGERGRSELGDDRCLVIRYEELAATPELVLRSVAAFLSSFRVSP
ncbi:MAG TPA: sulfotransferase [Streptosporangiaceae bacterium]